MVSVSNLRVVLISTYELGHQPFGLASPAAWLRAEGAHVSTTDLALQALNEADVGEADLVGVYVPMHTATRLAADVLRRIRALNPSAHVTAFGLYAPVNKDYLLGLGADSVIGGEFEAPMRELLRRLADGGSAEEASRPDVISLDRQSFLVPDRTGLPDLEEYASLRMPDGGLKVVGYTEASRGCKHLCRHCPIVPVYGGRFRVVQRETVIEDIAQQVVAGAEHVTFGDPDFFNGPAHALAIVRMLHERFPNLTYDVTIKVEHLVKHERHLPVLATTGCVLVTSAVEAFDERILEIFDKQHTRQDFERALESLRSHGIAMNPTFVAFTPWTSFDIYLEFLTTIRRHGLVGNVSPIQYAIRLLIPAGSRLLELPETQAALAGFDPDGLCYRWVHPDPRIDRLQASLFEVVADAVAREQPRHQVFQLVCDEMAKFAENDNDREQLAELATVGQVLPPPHLTEPWYCCAEPVDLRAKQTAPPV
jgi:radical SAM superfamily enzyme YgiQ (UPF0313 family)